ncbi:MAG TPA: hypothetical protein VLK37_02520 [Solirubrobacterales bacterium]|nr:hypothetical protein [Solirubrobacterales bacterium]
MRNLRKLGLAGLAAMGLMTCVGVSAASATTLTVNGVTKNAAVSITALVSGTKNVLKDEFGTTTSVCEASELKMTTITFTGTPSGSVSALSYSKCSHTTTVIAKGSLSFTWTSGINGTVSSSGTEVTYFSTFFGASAVCKTGAGTVLGTLTGNSSGGHATIDMNAKINCGILGSSSWTGTYTVTSPAGLGVTS